MKLLVLFASLAQTAEGGAEPEVHQPAAVVTSNDALYIPQPVVAVDDTRSEGPVARSWLELAADYAFIAAPDDAGHDGNVGIWKLRFGLGPPTAPVGQAHELFGALTHYAARLEASIVEYTDGTGAQVAGGPLTFGLQRFHAIEPLAIAPLVNVNTGIEIAVSTPWIDDHGKPPPKALAVVDGVDTELAASGWSIRPVSAYLRGDFLVCRADHLEVGVAPEGFIAQGVPTEYGMRFHADAGFSLACPHAKHSGWRHVTVDAGYRGRVRLYGGDLPVDYTDQLSVATQIDFTTQYIDGMFAVFGAVSPGEWHDWMIGVRAQLGIGGWFRRGR